MDDKEKQELVDEFTEKFERDVQRAHADALAHGYGFIAVSSDLSMGHVPIDFVVAWSKGVEEYTVEFES